MRLALLTAGAMLVIAAPAFADSTVTIEKKTITKEVPESGSTVSTTIVAPNPPPPPQAETPPPAPGPAVVWTPGHWTWDPATHAYVWSHGLYKEPPRAHAEWRPGHWANAPGGWVWQEGHWD